MSLTFIVFFIAMVILTFSYEEAIFYGIMFVLATIGFAINEYMRRKKDRWK